MKVIDNRKKKIPLITVIMSIYNEDRTLEKSIKSILNQKFNNFEFIILNDGSVDESEKIILKYLRKSNKILYIYSKQNKGLTHMLNIGIKYSKGNYIIRHDGDDYSAKNRIFEQYSFMEKNKNINILGTNSKDFFNKNYKFKITNMPLDSDKIRKNLIKKNCLIHSSLIIRKNFFKKVGLYDTNFLRCQDYEILLRGRDKFKYANIKKVLVIRNISKKRFKFIDVYLSCKARIMHCKNLKEFCIALISSFKDLVIKILSLIT